MRKVVRLSRAILFSFSPPPVAVILSAAPRGIFILLGSLARSRRIPTAHIVIMPLVGSPTKTCDCPDPALMLA